MNMKKTLLALAVAAMALSAFAQGGGKTKPAPKKIHCAVMTQNEVDIASATKNKMFADYKGKRYFFCCGMCPTAFKKEPAKYAKHDSIPVPKTVKKHA
jgi:YHS domain-containing protein